MNMDLSDSNKQTIALQAAEHEIVTVNNFSSIQDYVLYLMHESDYLCVANIVKDNDVLDLGCNCGYGTNILSDSCRSIIGVDVSPSAIEAARLHYQSPNVSFQLIDGVRLPFDDHSFDVITSFQVLEHLVDYEIYFTEIIRVLKPSGLLLLTTPNAEIRVLPGTKPWNRFHVHEFRGDELDEIIRMYFPFTQVLGQFATEETYSVEFNRCINARDAAPVPARSGTFRTHVISKLPVPLKNFLRSFVRRIRFDTSRALSESEMSKHSLKNFYYQTGELDRSLSLVACCSNDEKSLARAVQEYLNVNLPILQQKNSGLV